MHQLEATSLAHVFLVHVDVAYVVPYRWSYHEDAAQHTRRGASREMPRWRLLARSTSGAKYTTTSHTLCILRTCQDVAYSQSQFGILFCSFKVHKQKMHITQCIAILHCLVHPPHPTFPHAACWPSALSGWTLVHRHERLFLAGHWRSLLGHHRHCRLSGWD